MPRILLVKTSSLGDVVHNLPVVGDIRRHHPQAVIDWVVEEPFAPIPALHPGVRRVIPVAVRRWRKALLSADTREEFAQFRRLVGGGQYDFVIDTQGLIKSALLARAAGVSAGGARHGFDAKSAREGFAARFYASRHAVANGRHAVLRNRLLAAAALGYAIDADADGADTDYGIAIGGGGDGAGGAALPDALAGRRYAVLLHGTSRAEKCWPEAAWIDAGNRLAADGIASVLPWGNALEQARSRRIAAALPEAVIPEHAPLGAVARLLAGSAGVIGVDTGLMHLAVALGRPVVAILTSTDPGLTGAFGLHRAVNLGNIGAVPSAADVLEALARVVGGKESGSAAGGNAADAANADGVGAKAT